MMPASLSVGRLRPGSTLVEMILFIMLLAMSIGAVIALLLSANDNRIRQQALSDVEQNGIQIVQALGRRIRSAERVLDPAAGATGSVLAVQMADTTENPTIVALQSGSIVVARGNTVQTLSSSRVTVLDLMVRNVSALADRPSVVLQFTIQKKAELPVPILFHRPFETVITLFPDDEPEGNACGCAAPSCVGGMYQWRYCADEDTCSDADATGTLPCMP